MTLQNSSPGAGFVPAYQVSGAPFMTASTLVNNITYEIIFPYVTRFIKVSSSLPMFIGFSRNGIQGSNRYNILGESGEINIRSKNLYIRTETVGTASWCVMAGMTTILPQDFNFYTGSLTTSGTYYIPTGVG